MRSLLWLLSLTLTLTVEETMAQAGFQPPPPPPTSTTWPSVVRGDTTSATVGETMAQAELQSPPPPPTSPTWPSAVDGETTSATADDDSVNPFTDWPWWWWAAGGGGVFVIIIVVIVCCCCCCCRRRKRRRRLSRGGSAGDGEICAPPADFRRMESSAAKRYLHNIASVFSWGSDFEGEGPQYPGRPSSNVIYSNSTQGRDNIYANTQQLRVPATVAGPSSAPDWKSTQLYGNVGGQFG